jgi:hypothetical protein
MRWNTLSFVNGLLLISCDDVLFFVPLSLKFSVSVCPPLRSYAILRVLLEAGEGLVTIVTEKCALLSSSSLTVSWVMYVACCIPFCYCALDYSVPVLS